MLGGNKKFNEPYETFKRIENEARLGKIRFIVQEVKRGRSMRNIAKELGCSVENISILHKKGKDLKLA